MRRALALALLLAVITWSPAAQARPNDAVVREIVKQALSVEQRAGRYAAALEVLSTAREACAATACSRAVRADVEAAVRVVEAAMPRLTLLPLGDAEALRVELDGVPLAPDELGRERRVDPGRHLVRARGRVNGVAMRFERALELAPRERRTVEVELRLTAPDWLTGREARCLDAATSTDSYRSCLEPPASSLELQVRSELSAYHDDMDVDVLSPALALRVEDGAAGWGIGAAMVVDVVTAASVDILASASPPWSEVRLAPSLDGHKRFGDVDASLHGSISHEPDYLATAVGAGAALDLLDKTVTPSLGYELSYDRAGRGDTPFSVFSNEIVRHALQGGAGLVLTSTTFASIGARAVFERGDSSKPYRYVPLFAPDVSLSEGMSIDQVNAMRLSLRALEQLPSARNRYALALLAAHRFDDSTLRATERLYADDWGIAASTTDARWLVDVLPWLRLWPHGRFHVQSGASFWALGYRAGEANGAIMVPRYRTGDRELGPLWSLGGGGGARAAIVDGWSLTLGGDVVYTRFVEHLYTRGRVGVFGVLGAEAAL